MKHTYYYLFLVLITYSQSMWGQVPEPMKNISTPNVSTLGEYGDTPVNMYTGQPNISIPLYEIAEGDIKVPLSLRYDLSSVKPNRHPSWVGMGWNLTCGGQITRVVRGCMDEKQAINGYEAGFYAHGHRVNEITNETKLKEFQEYYWHDVSTDGYELSADEFIFNFCGYSGRFYLDSENGWTVISDDDIKVVFEATNAGFINTSELRMDAKWHLWSQKQYCNRFFNQFTLITPDGTEYLFGGKFATEYSISYYNQNASDLIPTTWFLVQIKNVEGKRITFEYDAGTPICELKYTPWEIHQDNIICSGKSTTGIGNNALSGYLLFPVYLKKINTTFVTVSFHSSVESGDYKQNSLFLALDNKYFPFSPYFGSGAEIPRFDIFLNNIDNTNIKTRQNSIQAALHWKRLNKIEIMYANGDYGNKAISFYYKMSEYHKLLSYISEAKTTSTTIGDNTDYTPKNYYFEYNLEQRLPAPVYGSEDHWGFWNGATFSFTNTVETLIAYKYGSLTHAKAETLKEITYPTGGKTQFEYELNSYSKVVAPTFTSLKAENGMGGGLRVSKITTYKSEGQIDRIKKYYYVKDLNTLQSSGILKSKPVYESIFCTDNQLRAWSIFGKKPLNPGEAWLGLRQAGGFIAQSTNNDSPIIGYSSVFEKSMDVSGNSLGYVHYQYSNYDEDIWGNSHLDEQFLFATASGESYAAQFSSKSQERGKLMSEDYYNSNGEKVKSIRYKYEKINGMSKEYLITIHQQLIFFCSDIFATQFGVFSSAFKTYTYSYLPSECIETIYSMNSGEVEKKTEFVYNQHKLLTQKTIYGNNNDKYKEKYFYSSDVVGNQLYTKMNKKHIMNALISTSRIKNDYVINSNYIKYIQVNDGSFKPSVLYLLNPTPRITETSLGTQPNNEGNPTNTAYKFEKEFFYDENGNLSCTRNKDDLYTTYLWGYENRYPIAEFKNATVNEVSSAYGNAAISPTEDIVFQIDKIEQYLPNAQISAYSYIPLIGIRVYRDPNGIMTYYNYDKLGRLLKVRDHHGKVLKEYTYHYQIK